MRALFLAGLGLAVMSGTALSGCASISKDTCEAGNWEALGYKDGTRGVRRDKVASYADRCSKYGISLNTAEYITGFNAGLPTYCTYERGYALGEAGSRYNQVCAGELAVDFAPGYDDGRAVYAIVQEHSALINRVTSRLDDIAGVRGRLETEDLTPEDRKRLRKKLSRFKAEVDERRIDLRAFERLHDLPRYSFD